MLKVRIIPCLDVDAGRVVKGVNFVDLVDAGDPVEQARVYDAAGADELCFLDITASHQGRDTLLDVVKGTAEQCFMPLTVGGGVRTTDDIRKLLLAGADKVSINTAAVKTPEFVRQAAEKFGSQCIVVAVEGSTRQSQITAAELAGHLEDSGAAAIIYTDISRDGAMRGPNVEATVALARATKVPVIASGGVSSMADLEALKKAGDGLLAGVISGRALYDGSIDLKAAVALLQY